MLKVCFAQQMRCIDRAAEEIGKIPSIVLMENAAMACVDELKHDFNDLLKARVAVFCGKGNNGGDGFAIARHLYNMGVEVCVYLVSGTDIEGDAKINFDIIKNMNVEMETLVDTDGLNYIVKSYDIIVDAILGTGISGTVRGLAYDVIKIINDNAKYIMSVDVPSGMNSDSGEICGVCINAHKTVTFAAYKIGMFKFPAAEYTGKISVKDISIPQYIIDNQNIRINVTDNEFVRNNIRKRKSNTQKGDYGKVLVIAGSKGMTGAAYLSSQAAVLSGSGLVTLGICQSINSVLEMKTTEVMTFPLSDSGGALAYDAADEIIGRLNDFDAVLFGPGLGRSKEIPEILRRILKHSKIPVVIDADGINALARDLTILSDCVCPVIFTPHAVEMSRLTGFSKEYIEENRYEVTAEFSQRYGVTVLLKGRYTLVTAQDGLQYTNITGNPGLATGGSGDVLAGILVSLLARGMHEATAAAIAAYIHGMAGDFAAFTYGEESVTAQNVMENIPRALCHILQLEN